MRKKQSLENKINVDKRSLKEIPARLILSLLKPETYFQSYWLIMESQTEEKNLEIMRKFGSK